MTTVDYSAFDKVAVEENEQQQQQKQLAAQMQQLATLDTSTLDGETRERAEEMKHRAQTTLLESEVTRRRATWDARKRDVPLCRGALTVERWLQYEESDTHALLLDMCWSHPPLSLCGGRSGGDHSVLAGRMPSG